MKLNKIIMLMLMVIFLFTLAGVSAGDVNETVMTSIEETPIEINEIDEIEIDENNEVLTANMGSFKDLQDKIDESPINFQLDGDYSYDSKKDGKDGIEIKKDNFELDGCGYTIDAKNQARIFKITGNNVIVKNLNIINGNAGNGWRDYGGAITGNCKAINCTFKENHAYYGGAMYGGSAVNCSFVNNSAVWGGAMCDGSAVNCSFVGNSANGGGAMYTGSAIGCSFVNNSANEFGGAMYAGSADTCIFKTGSDTWHGTYIFPPTLSVDNFTSFFNSGENITFKLKTNGSMEVSNGNISISVYYNNNSWFGNYSCLSGEGWVVDLPVGSYYAIFNTEYEKFKPVQRSITIIPETTFWALNQLINGNNKTEINLTNDYYYDSAYDEGFTKGIDINRPVTINGNGYTINAQGKAKAFFVKASDVTIKNLTIKNANYISEGGAIYWKGIRGSVLSSTFINNTAQAGGAIFWHENSGHVFNSTFIDNTARKGGAIFWNGGSGCVSNSTFIGNNADEEYDDEGGAIFWNGESGCVFNSTFMDNNAVSKGCSIYWYGDSGCVFNSTFIDDPESLRGSVIFWYGNNGCVSNSAFIVKTAGRYTAIYSPRYLPANYCWFGNTATDYTNQPPTFGSVNCTYRLFLNATAKPDTISVSDISNVIFKLYLYNSTSGNVTEYDNAAFGNLNLAIAATNGLANNTAKLGETIKYAATSRGTGSITASIENVEYTIGINNLGLNPNLMVNPQEAYYGNNTVIAIDYNSSATGTVNITLKGKNGNCYSFTNIALNATVVLSQAVNVDEYEVNVTYSGDHAFLNATATGTLTINKANSTLTVNNMTFNYGDEGSCEVSYTGATGIEAKVVGHDEAVVDVAGNIITVSNLDAGNYNLTVTAIADANHNNVTRTVNITVNRIDSTLTVGDVALDYGTSTNVTATAEGASGITAKINNQNATVKGNTIVIPVLDAGTYTLTVTTIADANHNSVTENATITVNRLKTKITADSVTTDYKVNKNLVITLKDSNGNPIDGAEITVNLNGAKNYTTDKNGQVKIATKSLAPKTYDVKIEFDGGTNYWSSSKTARITVKEPTKMKAASLTLVYKEYKYLVVPLKDGNGKGIPNVKVYITINGVTYPCKTNNKGNAKLIIRLKPKVYTAKIKFNGNSKYAKTTQSVKVTVKKAKPKLKAKSKTFKKSVKIKKYTVTLKDNTKKAIKKAKLTLKVGKKTYKAKTNKKGAAVFKFKNLTKKGAFKATVKFAGNAYYRAVTKTVKIKIR